MPERDAADAAADFPGLIGGATYRFRMRSTCPVPIDGNTIDADASQENRPNVTALVDLVIETNAPPRGYPLEIVPLRGVALRTAFKFTTGSAVDEPKDYPLRYTFQFLVAVSSAAGRPEDGQFVSTVVAQYYENTVCDSWLPYSAQPIRTMYEVCDSRDACVRYFGPNVTVERMGNDGGNDSDETDAKMLAIDEQIAGAMQRRDYELAFRVANITAISMRNGCFGDASGTRLAQFRDAQRTKIAEQCARLLKLLASASAPADATNDDDTSDFYVSPSDAAQFVRLAGQTLAVMSPQGETTAEDAPVLRAFLQLLDVVDENASQRGQRRRRKRAPTPAAGSVRNTNAIHERLQTMEALLQSSTGTELQQIKRNLTRVVHEFMLSLCKKSPFTPKSFSEFSTCE